MKTRRNLIQIWLLCAALLPTVMQAQFNYITINGTITITEYTGPGGAVTIPSTINGLPVTTIGGYDYGGYWYGAFHWCYSLTSVTIFTSVTSIGDWAFSPHRHGTWAIGCQHTRFNKGT
ncbi:MAG: hypothetical protein ABSF10_01795 [Verrucomicrobiota bacterium]|jgi:hypothetical protein